MIYSMHGAPSADGQGVGPRTPALAPCLNLSWRDQNGLSRKEAKEAPSILHSFGEDSLTLLTGLEYPNNKSFQLAKRNRSATKRNKHNTWFDSETIQISSLKSLFQILQEISKDEYMCVILGVPNPKNIESILENPDDCFGGKYKYKKNGTLIPNSDMIIGNARGRIITKTRRNSVVFRENPKGTRIVMIDFDSVGGLKNTEDDVERAIRAYLPKAFHGRDFVYQFSNSAGIKNPDGSYLKNGLNVHLWFYLNRGVLNEEKRRWIRDSEGLDKSLFSPWQIHYTARPKIHSGVDCDVAHRFRYVDHGSPEVKARNNILAQEQKDELLIQRGYRSRKAVDVDCDPGDGDVGNLIERLKGNGCSHEILKSGDSIPIFNWYAVTRFMLSPDLVTRFRLPPNHIMG